MKKVGLSILLVSLLAACASQKPKEAPAAEAAPAVTQKAASMEVDPLNDPHSVLAGRSVYYPFDVSVVQDADKPLLEAHAKYQIGRAHV